MTKLMFGGDTKLISLFDNWSVASMYTHMIINTMSLCSNYEKFTDNYVIDVQ